MEGKLLAEAESEIVMDNSFSGSCLWFVGERSRWEKSAILGIVVEIMINVKSSILFMELKFLK